MDTGLGERDGLLLHSLMDSHLILDVHFVELVNAADSVIGKHESSCFDAEVSSLGVLQHTGGETSSTGCLSTCVDGSWQERANVLQELRFGSSWVSNYADVDVSSQLYALFGSLLDSSEQLQKNTLLDIQVAIDGWSDRVGELCIETILILHSDHFVTLVKSKHLLDILSILFVISSVLAESESRISSID